jgi:hypothetical protein
MRVQATVALRKPIHTFQSRKDRYLKSFRTSPDPESGRPILNPPDSHAESCRYLAPGVTVDCPILLPKPRDSPRTASTGETHPQKISKVVAPRDTNQLFGKTLYTYRSVYYLLFSVIFYLPLTILDPPEVCCFSRDPSHFTRHKRPRNLTTGFYRLRRTAATAETGTRVGPAILRCRLLSSILFTSSWDLRIQSGITRTRISS